jgi:ComF family protein
LIRAAARSLLAQGLGGLADLLLPPACPLCDALLDDPRPVLCPECEQGLPWLASPRCPTCGQPLEGRGPCSCAQAGAIQGACAHIRSVLAFEGVAQEAVLALKLGGKLALAQPLGDLLQEAGGEDLPIREHDLLVPVPLHRSRLAQRGYNQAALLARRLSKGSGVPWDPDHLRRIRQTPVQGQAASREQRAANVRGAFRVVGRHPYRDRKICLVDDVVTTGATLHACAAALREAGAKEVNAVTVARTLAQ